MPPSFLQLRRLRPSCFRLNVQTALLFVVGWLVSAEFLATFAIGARGPAVASQAETIVRKPFTHAKHVPDAWLDKDVPERLRDCRGCHNYSASGAEDPQKACSKCHFGNGKNQYSFELTAENESFLTGLDALRTPGSLFQHSNHLALECRECHSVEGESASAPILMPKSGGLNFCLECHVGEKPRQAKLSFMSVWRDGTPLAADHPEKALVKLQRGLVGVLNDSLKMGPNRGEERYVEPFRHSDHIRPEFLGSPRSLEALRSSDRSARGAREADCAACHGPMFEASAGFKSPAGGRPHVDFEQSAQTCGSCHIADEKRTPIEFALTPGSHLSRTAGTFSHADHLMLADTSTSTGKASAEGRSVIEAKGCQACHEYDPSASVGYGLGAGLTAGLGGEESFRGCQACHMESAWAPVAHGTWWTPEDHGDWQGCSNCHEFGAVDFATRRLQSEVRRHRPATFRIETQSHPHITVAEGEPVQESCARCHRQPVRELPSRIQEAPFRHASHLPLEPVAEDCAGCHRATIAGAARSVDIGTRVLASGGGLEALADDQLGLTYDSSACSQCHLGSVPVATEGEAAIVDVPARVVPEFSHAAHLGQALAGGRSIGCTDCHAPGAGALGGGALEGPDIGTLEAAMDCTLCHDHSGSAAPDRAAVTGAGITAPEVAACSLCHVGGIPAIGGSVQIPGAHVVDLAGAVSQFHPSGEECVNCHIPGEGIIAAPVPSTHSRVFALRTFYYPDEGTTAKPAIHRGDTRKLAAERVICFACHWTDTLVDSGDSGTAIPDPERPAIRASQGDSLVGFPGGSSDDFER